MSISTIAAYNHANRAVKWRRKGGASTIFRPRVPAGPSERLLEWPPKGWAAVITTSPGEEAQVDYGEGPMVRHPDTGKYRRTRLFVLTLGYSRKCVRLLVWRSSSQVAARPTAGSSGGTPPAARARNSSPLATEAAWKSY